MTRFYIMKWIVGSQHFKQGSPECIISCFRFEPCWSALAKDTNGVIFVYNPDQPNHDKDLENWYACKTYSYIFWKCFESVFGKIVVLVLLDLLYVLNYLILYFCEVTKNCYYIVYIICVSVRYSTQHMNDWHFYFVEGIIISLKTKISKKVLV